MIPEELRSAHSAAMRSSPRRQGLGLALASLARQLRHDTRAHSKLAQALRSNPDATDSDLAYAAYLDGVVEGNISEVARLTGLSNALHAGPGEPGNTSWGFVAPSE